MTRSSICVLALLSSLASIPLHAQLGTGQSRPLTDETTIALGESGSHDLAGPGVAALGQREFLVTWDLSYQQYSGSQLVDWGSAISGRKVSLLGQPTGDELVLEPFEQKSVQSFHNLAADAAGRFVTFWFELDTRDLLLRLFDPDGNPLETTRLTPDPGAVEYPDRQAVAMDPAGTISAAWARKHDVNQPPNELWMQLFDKDAEPTGDSFETQTPSPSPPALAMARGGSILVDHFRVGDEILLAVQRFDARGRPVGRKVPVADGSTARLGPAIAANPEGRFVVTWLDNFGIGARLFDAAGKRVGPVIRVERATFVNVPGVAMDAHGNFVVIWQIETGSNGESQLRTRFYNRDGVPQGGSTVVAPHYLHYFYNGAPPGVAFSEVGTFLAGWVENALELIDNQYLAGIRVRTYAVPRDDDRCAWRAGILRCDTARDGALHQELPFGVAAGDRLLLADFDGDGVDNPCVRRANTFRCTRPGLPDLVLRFGRSAHFPLAGDLDGDGDDDPCVRSGRAFLCDTAHDAGAPEVVIPLGIGADEPLLGDIDGDGDDDPCVWRRSAATFLCDADHDGTPDLAHTLAEARTGDRPLLGDLDGDGPADFCLGRSENLLCDLDRDGVLTQEVFATHPGDLVLLGNVDGV